VVKRGLGLLIGLVALAGAAMAAPASGGRVPRAAGECPPGQILMKAHDGTDPAAIAARHGAVIVDGIAEIGVSVLAVPAGTVGDTMRELQGDPEVDFAEPNGATRVPEAPANAGPEAVGTNDDAHRRCPDEPTGMGSETASGARPAGRVAGMWPPSGSVTSTSQGTTEDRHAIRLRGRIAK
jgi:hypothetical protein